MFPPAPPQPPMFGAPPPDPAAPSPTPQPPAEPQAYEMSATEVRDWWARLDLDKKRRDRESKEWRQLMKAYLPPKFGGDVVNINSNIHFRDVHLKTAEIWAQLPELVLTPLEPLQGLTGIAPPPMPGQPPQPPPPVDADEIVSIKRAVLNKKLGRDEANVDKTIEEVLFDIFATSGIGATNISYQADIKKIPQEQPTAPVPQPGAILGLQDQPGGTEQAMTPVVVNERYKWYRFSPEKLIIPSDFHSTDYDSAPYLGMEFSEPATPQNLEKYNLPPDFQPTQSRDERIISRDQDVTNPGAKKLITGVEIWLYACYFDPDEANTQVMRRLVLIDGQKDKAAVYTGSPHQSVDPGTGRLTPDSMIGNPIHPFVLRVASDTAWIPSDAAFTDPLVRIENTWMSQDIKMRDANVPRFFHSDKITQAVDKLKNADSGQGVAVPDAVMTQGPSRLIAQIPHLEHAQADSEGRAQNQQAIAETLGISPNQAGSYTRSTKSATEVATVQANVSVRLKKEQNNLLARFLAGVTKFDSLIQRYMTDPGYVQIVGANGLASLKPFTQAHLAGRYAYDARPDSQLTIDQASKIKQYNDFVNFMAKSGFLNMKNVARVGATTYGYNPSEMIQDPQPPPPPAPPPVAISMAFKAADLAIPEVRIVLQERGIQLPPISSPELQAESAREAQKAAQPPPQPMHGGSADKVDLVEKHSSEKTGHQPGQAPISGEPVPAMPVGRMVQ